MRCPLLTKTSVAGPPGLGWGRWGHLATSRRLARTTATQQQPPPQQDQLRRVFDDADHWQAVRTDARTAQAATGLFDYPQLGAQPGSFVRAARHAMAQAEALVARIHLAASPSIATTSPNGHNAVEERRRTIRRMDRLSDIVCSVVDAAELVRSVHPSQAVARDANEAHTLLSQYLNQLNTTPTLYQALEQVLADPTLSASLGREERRVGELLLWDFRASGIHLPEHQRRRFVELNDSILEHGKAFVEHCPVAFQASAHSHLLVEDAPVHLAGVPAPLLARWTRRARGSLARAVHLPVREDPGAVAVVLRSCSSAETRHALYRLLHTPRPEQVERLERMLHGRHELASLLGAPSYGHLRLRDLMSGSPEQALQFLGTAADRAKRSFAPRLAALNAAKGTSSDAPVRLPDLTYYEARLPHDPFADVAMPSISLGTAFSALGRLIHTLYGVTLESCPLKPGEVWDAAVRKFRVLDHQGEALGVLYCDLFQRRFHGAAHFTVRCSRRTDMDEPFDAAEFADPALVEPVLACPELRGTYRAEGTGERHPCNLPVVVLVTAFPAPTGRAPSMLSLEQVGILYHEMGHVMHSMLSRTEFQHVSGTRVQGDFVEVPSVFMEMFLRSPTYLHELFAQQHLQRQQEGITAEPRSCPSLPQLEAMLAAREHVTHLADQQSALLAIADQLYHHPDHALAVEARVPGYTTTLYEHVMRQHGALPPMPGISPPCGLPHLFSYGATYYSYLWAQALVDVVWDRHFAHRPPATWAEGGELLRDRVIGRGGSRDAWELLAGLGCHPSDVIMGESRAP